jgi:EmrB/QacA subfamily drug resistance transporter
VPASGVGAAELASVRPATRLTALIVACALFMQSLDGTVIATALPAMARTFHADPVRMNVALTSYLLSLAVFIPASGWMADRFGARSVFRAAIAVFTLGSVLCGFSDTLAFLVGARVVQGAGGAMMVPVGRLILLRTAAKHELVAAMAWLSAPALLGPVIGPPLGGVLVDYASWRWIFDLNIPIGVLGILLVTRFMAETASGSGRSRLDLIGLVLSGLSLVGLMAGVEIAGRDVAPPIVAVGAFAVSLVASALYWRHARVHPAPLLDLSLLRIPTFGVSVASGSLFRIGVGATPFLLPLMIQLGFGQSATQSGLITFASSAGAILMKPATTFMLRRIGFRDTLTSNGLLAGASLLACAAFRPAWPIAAIYAVLLVGGLLRSLQFTALNTVAFVEVPGPRMSAATSLYSTMQQVSLTFGVAAGAASLQISRDLSGHAHPMLGDFSTAFLVVGTVTLLGAPICMRLSRMAGADVSGHRRAELG